MNGLTFIKEMGSVIKTFNTHTHTRQAPMASLINISRHLKNKINLIHSLSDNKIKVVYTSQPVLRG